MITINKTRKYEDKTEMNEEIKNMYAALGIQPDVLAFGEDILKNLESRFQEIDTVAEYNQLKVLKAMHEP